MKRCISIFLLAITLAAFASWQQAEAETTQARLQVVPMDCVFEYVNDGSNTIRYITPAECGVTSPTSPPLQPAEEVFVPAGSAPQQSGNPQDITAVPLHFGSSSLITHCSDTNSCETSEKNGGDSLQAPIKEKAAVLQYNEIILIGVGAAAVAGLVADAIFFRMTMTKTGAVCIGNLCKRLGGKDLIKKP